MRLIGCRCKASDGFSWAVLIGRGLDLVPDLLFPLFSFEGAFKDMSTISSVGRAPDS